MEGLMKINHSHNVLTNNVFAPAEVIKGKSIRLFGCDVYLSETQGSSMKESISINERYQNSSDSTHSLPVQDEDVKEPKGGPKYYKCQFCDRLYTSSQALGGHQNAHKSERVSRKKMQHEANKASIDVYLRSLQSSLFMQKSAKNDDDGAAASRRRGSELGGFNPIYNYRSYKYASLSVDTCDLQVHVRTK